MLKLFQAKYILPVFLGLAFLGSAVTDIKAQESSASLYLTPSSGTHVINSTFTVSVKVNTGGQPINAAEGTLTYDSDRLDVVSISKGGSIFNLWTQDPKDSGSSIGFGGGIPQPGYSGAAGTLFSVTFKAVKTDGAQISFSSGAVLANDGRGTNILASMGSGRYTISPKVEAPARDTTPPPSNNTSQPDPEPVERQRIKPEIVSLTHPDEQMWYKAKDVKFEWELPDGVSGVSFLFDNEPNSIPGNVSDGEITEKEFSDLEDGVYYFHLKFRDGSGWGTVAHYRLQIDNTPPLPFEVGVKKEEGEDWPVLEFGTDDELSGVINYEIIIGSLEEKAYEADAEKPSIKVSGLEVGEHTALVKAIDAAGNETYSEQKFYINPIETPLIKKYPERITTNDNFYISGSALPNVSIMLYLQKEGTMVKRETRSDSAGNWFVVVDEKLSGGNYAAWVVAKNDNNLTSKDSEKVVLTVGPPVFKQIGDFVVNYFTVFVSLLFLTILTILLSIVLARYAKKKLRKEATEVEEVLAQNIRELRKEVEKDFQDLSKGRKSAAQKKILEDNHKKLKEKIDAMEKKVMKEVRDVEDLAK